MHLRKAAGFEEIIDRRALRAHAARQLNLPRRGVSAAKPAALHAVRLEPEQRSDFFCGDWGGHWSYITSARAQYNNRVQVQVYTAAWCRDCRAAKQFLEAHGVVYTEINVDSDPAASEELVRRVGKRAIPQMVIDGEWFQPYRPGRGLLLDELHRRLRIPRS